MPREIERKFLINHDKAPMSMIKLCRNTIIEQYYLSITNISEIRMRRCIFKTDRGKPIQTTNLTIKSCGDLSRVEVNNIPIDAKGFNDIIENEMYVGIPIEKTRYYVELKDSGKIASVDVYTDNTYSGLIIIEVEFTTEEEASEFNPPDWFGEEVTYDKRYKNKNLAKESLAWVSSRG